MVDGVVRHHEFSFIVIVAAGVQIADKTGEVTAGNLQPDTMTFKEYVAGGVQVDVKPIDSIGLHKYLLFKSFAVAGAQYAVLDIVGPAIRIDIDQFDCEVRVFCRG